MRIQNDNTLCISCEYKGLLPVNQNNPERSLLHLLPGMACTFDVVRSLPAVQCWPVRCRPGALPLRWLPLPGLSLRIRTVWTGWSRWRLW